MQHYIDSALHASIQDIEIYKKNFNGNFEAQTFSLCNNVLFSMIQAAASSKHSGDGYEKFFEQAMKL